MNELHGSACSSLMVWRTQDMAPLSPMNTMLTRSELRRFALDSGAAPGIRDGLRGEWGHEQLTDCGKALDLPEPCPVLLALPLFFEKSTKVRD